MIISLSDEQLKRETGAREPAVSRRAYTPIGTHEYYPWWFFIPSLPRPLGSFDSSMETAGSRLEGRCQRTYGIPNRPASTSKILSSVARPQDTPAIRNRTIESDLVINWMDRTASRCALIDGISRGIGRMSSMDSMIFDVDMTHVQRDNRYAPGWSWLIVWRQAQ